MSHLSWRGSGPATVGSPWRSLSSLFFTGFWWFGALAQPEARAPVVAVRSMSSLSIFSLGSSPLVVSLLLSILSLIVVSELRLSGFLVYFYEIESSLLNVI